MTDRREPRRRIVTTMLVVALAAGACSGSGSPTTGGTMAPTTGSPDSGGTREVTTTSDPSPSTPLTRSTCGREGAPNDGGAAPEVASEPAGLIRFVAYGPGGELLDHRAFAALQTNGQGDTGFSDTLLDPSTLEVIEIGALYPDEQGAVVLDRPAGPVALSLAWPTELGYSTLIVDLPGPGTHLFNLLVARQAVADLDRYSVGASAGEWQSLRAGAGEALALAETLAAENPAAAAAAADRALELSSRAALLPRFGPRADGPLLPKGVTIDRVVVDPELWNSVAALAGDRTPWARIVFDPGVSAEVYRSTIDAARAAGVRVLGELLDSSAMAQVPLADFEARVEEYVDAFPDLDAWEVGNEVNGNWLGSDVAEKIAFATKYVKANATGCTMLTLYWQLGEDTESSSMFSWAAANLDADTIAGIDDISVSMWVQGHPMGTAFDRVFTTLARRYPAQRLLIGELGYGNDDLELLWWWGDASDPTGAGRRAVAETYLPLMFDRPWLSGGGFWWYYLDDLYPPNDLWGTIAAF